MGLLWFYSSVPLKMYIIKYNAGWVVSFGMCMARLKNTWQFVEKRSNCNAGWRYNLLKISFGRYVKREYKLRARCSEFIPWHAWYRPKHLKLHLKLSQQIAKFDYWYLKFCRVRKRPLCWINNGEGQQHFIKDTFNIRFITFLFQKCFSWTCTISKI